MTETTTMPEAGQQAPEFAGRTQTGETVRLADFHGRKLALYFYPEDDTPGCTAQACNLRDDHTKLLDAGVAVVGVSVDDVDSHARFAEKYGLPFPLIADTDHKMVNDYGVWGERNLYGHKFIGLKRTTFLIDEQGKIVHIIRRPKVAEHADEVLRKFGLA